MSIQFKAKAPSSVEVISGYSALFPDSTDGNLWKQKMSNGDVIPLKGDTGAPGTNGTNGTNGSAATIAVGTVTTGAPGSDATVTNSGSSSAAVFDFEIPRGATGSQGAAGSDGLDGVGFVGFKGSAPFTENGDGTVTTPTVVLVSYTDSNKTATEEDTITGGVVSLVDESANFIVADKNTNTFVALQNSSLIDYVRYWPYGECYRSGTNVHTQPAPITALTGAEDTFRRMIETARYARAYGGENLSVNASLELVISAIRVFSCNTPYNIVGSSTTSREFFCYHSSGNWARSTALNPKIRNTQYDNGTDLVTLTDTYWTSNYIYRGVEDEDHVYIVLGSSEYATKELAQADNAVPEVPELISSHAIFVGRVIVQKGETSNYVVESAFKNTFSGATAVSNHEVMDGLQGGQANEHYHMTQAEHAAATREASGSQSGLLASADWTSFNSKISATNSEVLGKVLTGFSASAGVVAATDTILQAFNKIVGNLSGYLSLAGGTMTGLLNLKTFKEVPVSKGNISGSTNFDWSEGSVQKASMTGSITITFSNAVEGQSLTLLLTQGGNYTITWPTLKFDGGGSPTISTTAGKKILVSFYYDGTDYLSSMIGGNF